MKINMNIDTNKQPHKQPHKHSQTDMQDYVKSKPAHMKPLATKPIAIKPIAIKPIALALMLSFSGLANAVETPNAGTLQQQIKPTLPASPSKEGMDLPESTDTGVQDSTPFTVTKLNIDGNQSIDTATLYELVKGYEGQTHTITELQQACKTITEYYRAQGYRFSRAVLPQQEITTGEVRIQIIEAQYGSINLQNNSRVSDRLINSTLSTLHSGEQIQQKPLDRALLLLSDLPGTNINANIKPGATVGQSDINITIEPTPIANARLAVDDFGNRYIGRARASASLNLLNPLKQADALSLNLITTGNNMKYGQVAYELLLNGYGTRAGVAYSALSYKLGEELKTKLVHGTASTAEAWVKHPIIRSQSNNLYATLKYQHNILKDRTDSANIKNDRNLDNFIASLNGDIRDNLLTGGVNSYQLSYSTGDVDFDNTTAKASDAITTNTQGQYSKVNYNVNRLQNISGKTQLWLSLTGQAAYDNLDPSQKMVFGGPYSVRAYDNGAISGDNGNLATAELRTILGQGYGTWQGVLFIDAAQVQVNERSWVGNTGQNNAHLSGVGAGVNWYGPKQTQARAFVATSIGDGNALTKSADRTIGWVEFSINFF